MKADRVHDNSNLDVILRTMNAVHILISYFSKFTAA
jgi:hypothetical protein